MDHVLEVYKSCMIHVQDGNNGVNLRIPINPLIQLISQKDTTTVLLNFNLEEKDRNGIVLDKVYERINIDMSGDPYPRHAGAMVPLGYHLIRICPCDAVIKSFTPITITCKRKDVIHMMARPAKPPSLDIPKEAKPFLSHTAWCYNYFIGWVPDDKYEGIEIL